MLSSFGASAAYVLSATPPWKSATMPEPPDVSVFTRYVLENPWPLGLAFLLLASWFGWSGIREGLGQRLRAAGILAALGAAVFITGWIVVTAGEHAKMVTRQLVDAVVKSGAGAAATFFTDDAVLTFGSPKNPGYGDGIIQSRLIPSADRFRIESSTITMLKGYGESSDSALAYLGCYTTVDGFPNISQWVLHVKRQSVGSWKVSRLTCVSINDQTPPIDVMIR